MPLSHRVGLESSVSCKSERRWLHEVSLFFFVRFVLFFVCFNVVQSCDAAGYPMMALLFTPEEAASSLNHAIRFILPNQRMRLSSYRHPATHCGGGSNTNANAIEYGTRIRLQSSFPETGAPGMISLIRGLKKYVVVVFSLTFSFLLFFFFFFFQIWGVLE
jgi:hypothetical protein